MTGFVHILVTCSTCDGSGEAKGVTRKLEFVKEVCPTCNGKGQLSVNRRAQ